MDLSGKHENIEKIIKSVANDLNYMVYESSILIKGDNSRLIIKIDRLQGISHADCGIFSKELARRLDNENVLPNYSMEISSPGLSRKLRTLDEFIRFKGSMVKIIFDSDGTTRVIKGIINNIIDTKIELNSDNNKIIIEFEKIKKANLEY